MSRAKELLKKLIGEAKNPMGLEETRLAGLIIAIFYEIEGRFDDLDDYKGKFKLDIAKKLVKKYKGKFEKIANDLESAYYEFLIDKGDFNNEEEAEAYLDDVWSNYIDSLDKGTYTWHEYWRKNKKVIGL